MNKFSRFENYLKEYKYDALEIDFSEIEEISNVKLCASARKYKEYWNPNGHMSIASSIVEAGFKVEKIDLANEILYLKRVKK